MLAQVLFEALRGNKVTTDTFSGNTIEVSWQTVLLRALSGIIVTVACVLAPVCTELTFPGSHTPACALV